jgi:hypothetical protein
MRGRFLKKFAVVSAIVLLVGGGLPSSAQAANIVLNGNLDNNTSIGCDSNLSNADFTAKMANAVAFGSAQELDIYHGACFGGNAPTSGDTKVAVNTQGANGAYDAFSLQLSELLNAGQPYTLDFDAVTVTVFGANLGPLWIGVSSAANSFGDLVLVATPQADVWTHFTTTFLAPSAAGYLTISGNHDDIRAWNHVDSFSLEAAGPPIPEPGSLFLLGSGAFGLLAKRRQRKG